MSKPVAVFFYASPGQEMRNQGISRLLTNQMRGLADAQGHLEIFTPLWNKRKLIVIAKDQGISLSGITFRSSQLTALEFLVINLGTRIIDKKTRQKNHYGHSGILLKRHILSLLAIFSPAVLVSLFKLIGINSVIFVILSIFLSYPTYRILVNLRKRSIQIIRKLAQKIVDDQKEMLISQCNQTDFIWIVPSPHQNLISKLRNKVILIVPDLVHVEYPFAFSTDLTKRDAELKNLISEFKNTISLASKVITYSSHVKFKQVLPLGTHSEDQIRVVPNANTRQFVEVDIEGTLATSLKSKNYFFYPTQIRPYKNLENLVFALYLLNLKRQEEGNSPVELYLTSEESQLESIQNLLRIFELEDLVKVTGKLSGTQMSEFYKGAIAGISPSWHEGGFFFFQISEAWDSNTPCIFSNTSANRELLPEGSLTYTFDPGNVQEIADKMEFVIQNRDEVLRLQKHELSGLFQRSWKQVGLEIINVSHELS
jgi:glycosyltransferase involved in cell wall biosynthesis